MKDFSFPIEKHLFICNNKRDGKQSCGGSGSDALIDELKKWSKAEGINQQVRVNKSGCLGPCEHGIVAVCYPEGRWLTELTPDNAEKLKTILK